MAVGYLPLARIGDVLQGQSSVTQLRAQAATIELLPGMQAEYMSVMTPRPPPPGWTGSYRALNRFEFELGNQKEVSDAHCILIQAQDVDYLIPGTVIFQTFYGFHTNVANAFCSGQWQTRYRDVISDTDYQSGLRTEVDQATGDWYIVVNTGLTRSHAIRLALLKFDPFGFDCACDIHADALRQNKLRSGSEERFWFARPQIPYRWDEAPFRMEVRGYPLRPHRPSEPSRPRFLVTSIDAYSWPYAEQVIHSEIANSNARSDKPPVKAEPRPYHPKPKPPPVPADPRADPDHHQDPGWDEATNQAFDGTFSFLNEPQHLKQEKQSHKQYEPSRPRPKPAPSPVLSGGNEASGEGRPAPVAADTRERCSSQQLQFLLDALDGLRDEKHIDRHEPLAPPADSPLRRTRNRISCWSFLSEEQIRKRGRNDRGWEFLFEKVLTDAGACRRSYPRCMLVLRVTIEKQDIIVFEIEPRQTEAGYCTYLMKPTTEFNFFDLAAVVENIRRWAGRVDPADMRHVFDRISSSPIARRHRYARQKGGGPIQGFDPESLLRGLRSALAGSVGDVDE